MALVEVNQVQVTFAEKTAVSAASFAHGKRRNVQPDWRIRLREIDPSARAGWVAARVARPVLRCWEKR